jgi:CheY-like chemotaxis protein
MTDPTNSFSAYGSQSQRFALPDSEVNPEILIIEDDVNDAFLIERAFSSSDFRCSLQTVRDGLEALKHLEEAAQSKGSKKKSIPRLLILDLKMPRLDGFEFLDWLRRQPLLKRTITVVLSSSGRPEDVNRAYDLGANCFVQKPLGVTEYRELVKSLYSFWVNLNRCAPVQEDGIGW